VYHALLLNAKLKNVVRKEVRKEVRRIKEIKKIKNKKFKI
jgi:hypothetical protein